MWAGACSYLSALRDIIGLRGLDVWGKYQAWEDAAKHGGFRVMHEEFCIVSDFPTEIHVDDQHRPHAEHGPSHRWRDGWALYHWHGVRVPERWIMNKQSLTAAEVLQTENVEQRRAGCEILGWNHILRELNAVEIDVNPNPQIGTLLEVDLPDAGKERFVRVKCGTGRMFALPVPPDIQTALEAQQWMWNDPTYNPEVRT